MKNRQGVFFTRNYITYSFFIILHTLTPMLKLLNIFLLYFTILTTLS